MKRNIEETRNIEGTRSSERGMGKEGMEKIFCSHCLVFVPSSAFHDPRGYKLMFP